MECCASRDFFVAAVAVVVLGSRCLVSEITTVFWRRLGPPRRTSYPVGVREPRVV